MAAIFVIFEESLTMPTKSVLDEASNKKNETCEDGARRWIDPLKKLEYEQFKADLSKLSSDAIAAFLENEEARRMKRSKEPGAEQA
jgi:hypothetical protein